jgi:hypothetical protein
MICWWQDSHFKYKNRKQSKEWEEISGANTNQKINWSFWSNISWAKEGTFKKIKGQIHQENITILNV